MRYAVTWIIHPTQAQVVLKTLGVWRGKKKKKVSPAQVFLCPGFVQLVEQRMEFGHCSKLEFLVTSGVGFTALLLFWVSAHVRSLH